LHLMQMRSPVRDPVVEDRADQGVVAHTGVEALHQGVDHGFVDAGFGPDARDDRFAAHAVFGLGFDGAAGHGLNIGRTRRFGHGRDVAVANAPRPPTYWSVPNEEALS